MKETLLKITFFVLLIFSNAALFSQTLNINDVLFDEATCFSANDGMITIIPANGTLPYEYSIDSAETFQSDSIFTGLVPGNYDVAVRDAVDTIYHAVVININQPSEVEIDLGNDIVACEGYILDVSDSYDTYEWSTGNTTNIELIDESGTYILTVTDGAGGCGFDDIDVTIYNYPNNTMPEIVPYCGEGGVTLTANGGTNYFWNTGDNTVSTVVNPDEDTEYFVTVVNYICLSYDTVLVKIYESFTSEITAPEVFCEAAEFEVSVVSYLNDSIEYTDESFYWWSFNDSGNEATTSLSEPGNISVMSYTSGSGCSNETSVYIETMESPIIAIVDTLRICEGETTSLFVEGEGNYLWSTGGTTQSIEVTPTNDSVYTVTVTLDNDCSTTATTNVVIDTINSAFAGYDQFVCVGSTTNLLASGGDVFTWVYGIDTIATTQNVEITPGNSGSYIVHVESGSCSDSDTVYVNLRELPSAELGDAEQSTCEGTAIILSPESLGFEYIYEWSTGETSSQILVSENSTVSLTVTDIYGCIGVPDEVIVSIIETPELKITGNINLCQGESTVLTVTGANNYLWNTGSTESTITVSPTVTTTYSVLGYTQGCFAETDIEVNYIDSPLPTIELNGDIDICGSGTLDAGAGYAEYLWSTGETTHEILVDNSGLYSVTVTNDGGCFVSDSTTITILEVPFVNLGEDITMQYDGVIVLSASGDYDFLWSTDETSNSIVIHGSDLGYGYHNIWVIATAENGCSASDTNRVYVKFPVNASNLEKDILKMYPNPSNGMVYIEINDNEIYNEVQFINFIGQIVASKKLENPKEEINLQHIEKGIYIVKFIGNNVSTYQKITIN